MFLIFLFIGLVPCNNKVMGEKFWGILKVNFGTILIHCLRMSNFVSLLILHLFHSIQKTLLTKNSRFEFYMLSFNCSITNVAVNSNTFMKVLRVYDIPHYGNKISTSIK